MDISGNERGNTSAISHAGQSVSNENGGIERACMSGDDNGTGRMCNVCSVNNVRFACCYFDSVTN